MSWSQTMETHEQLKDKNKKHIYWCECLCSYIWNVPIQVVFIVKSTKQNKKIAIIIRIENCDHHNERTKESRLSNFINFCNFVLK